MLPEETIASGGPKACEDCGKEPILGVYQSAAGYYVGTFCECGPYSRESGYYLTQELAQAALSSGQFGRSPGYLGKVSKGPSSLQ